MSREDYVAIAARLFAVYVGIKTVLQIPTAARILSTQPDTMAYVAVYALMLLLTLAFCAFLWFFPLTIARKLMPVMKEPRSEQAIDASVGLSLGLTLIGFWLFAQGVVDAVYWLALILRTRQEAPVEFSWRPEQIASMVMAAFQLGFGAFLVLGSAGIKRFIDRARYAGS
ncbi:hypothetical protein LYSHEL_20380 [Lysobacter helvus]|uniref:Uncharacterized protein n=2 Tax=Lysobacteraceae TaxID=32033 RepID=A0ABN6FVK7_9GAMM|nr:MULTISPECIES: hypothetical protein [Lysobacter]BCT93015.1 hypothetical protein LYSCAS_20390 [Lysobacter caseinilyticus]BCT96167.1 hypothetical protein LYSHEL_20380 [Lysobacter helvus]